MDLPDKGAQSEKSVRFNSYGARLGWRRREQEEEEEEDDTLSGMSVSSRSSA